MKHLSYNKRLGTPTYSKLLYVNTINKFYVLMQKLAPIVP